MLYMVANTAARRQVGRLFFQEEGRLGTVAKKKKAKKGK